MEMCVDVKTIMVEQTCPECNNGLMKFDIDVEGTTKLLISDHPAYLHTCNNCGFTEIYNMKYPYIKNIPIEPFLREMTDDEKR